MKLPRHHPDRSSCPVWEASGHDAASQRLIPGRAVIAALGSRPQSAYPQSARTRARHGGAAFGTSFFATIRKLHSRAISGPDRGLHNRLKLLRAPNVNTA